jgi:predicted CopG family antitoxin
MTLVNPSLVLKRLIVTKGGAHAYDEAFHQGVNVIRGANSSGKSTIINAIFYALGGDVSEWSEHALTCDSVIAEVELNGLTASLSRQISAKQGQPMDIYGGPAEEALAAGPTRWKRYPYARSESRESFSEAVLELLGIPEAIVGTNPDSPSKLTLHQVLRLLYADQLSPVDVLFRFEQFDSPITRDSVGRLLCGVFDSELYANEIRAREIGNELSEVRGQLTNLFSLLGGIKHDMSLLWVEAERQKTEEEQQRIRVALEEAERRSAAGETGDPASLAAMNRTYSELQELQADIARLQEERDSLTFTIADSSAFMADIERRLTSLKDAEFTADQLGQIDFNFCPACFAPVEVSDGKSCHLCKSSFDSEQAKRRITQIATDLSVQLRESQLLQRRRQGTLREVQAKLASATAKWRATAEQYRALQRVPSSDAQAEVARLNREAGYLQRKLEDLKEKASLVAVIQKLTQKREDLSSEHQRLLTRNEQLRAAQDARKRVAYTAIAEEVRELIKGDLRRQDAFVDPQRVEFDFGGNSITVDGRDYFSASSRVILKSSFTAGFMFAACRQPFFRHPRFCLIDTIEDKGMEPKRSQNFQLELAERSRREEAVHQIIFATSMIAPDLDRGGYTVVHASSLDNPTLRLAG